MPQMPSPSLTPARKHRKLLKTSAGTEEVWSEAIELVFVQGLREYWNSPFANPSARGRSRWRNQFLVDYLSQNGVQRTKKQVASHIQVLRNMWKGQSEFHLVAGAEDAADQAEDQLDHSTLISMDQEESSTLSPDTSSFSSLSTDSPRTVSSLPLTPDSYQLPLHHHSSSPLKDKPLSNNRISMFCLTAPAMTPFQVKVDALVPSSPTRPAPPVMLQTKVTVAHPNDPACPQSFNGFTGLVTVANVWSSFACCVTRVFDGQRCISETSDALDVVRIELGAVVASLPDSELSRCRWLESTSATSIVQDIIVDNAPIFRVIYQLDRSGACPYPSAELVKFTQVPTSQPQKTTTQPAPQYSPSLQGHGHYRQYSLDGAIRPYPGHALSSPISQRMTF